MRDKIRQFLSHRWLEHSRTWNGFVVVCICSMLMFLGLRMRSEYRGDQTKEMARLETVSNVAVEAAKAAAYNKGILDARTPLFKALTEELHRTRTEGTVTDARIYEKLVRIEALLSAERARATSPSRPASR